MQRPDYSALTDVLEEMNREGGFSASILARDDGLRMAEAVSPTTNPEVVAAMSGYLGDTVERIRKELDLGEIRDITLRCTNGKAVFKKIKAGREHPFILAALMPRHVRYHARAIGKAATQIRHVMR